MFHLCCGGICLSRGAWFGRPMGRPYGGLGYRYGYTVPDCFHVTPVSFAVSVCPVLEVSLVCTFGMNGGFVMERFKKPRRRKLRLPKYDYTQAGAYYVTICSYKKRCIFGEVVARQMILNRYGKIVQTAWMEIDHHFPTVKTDQFVVMPNHIHGIFVLTPDSLAGGFRRPSLGMIVGSFKSVTAKNINELRGTEGADVWQRNYYEHIIRNEQSMEEIREYIANNPRNWERDPENPT